MTSFRNDGRMKFEVKHSSTSGGYPLPYLTEYSTRTTKTVRNALPNPASKDQAQSFVQVFTRIAVALGCFAGLFLQDVLAQEYNAVDRFPLVDQGKVRDFDEFNGEFTIFDF